MTLRIRDIRKQRGFSQQQLAEMAGLSRSLLSEIETSSKPGNTIRLAAVATALGVEVAELFVNVARKPYMIELDDLMNRMSDEDRQTILKVARALVGATIRSDMTR